MRSRTYPNIYALARAGYESVDKMRLYTYRGDWAMGIVVRGCEGRSWLDSARNVYVFSSMEVVCV